jgi:hypothetical protein
MTTTEQALLIILGLFLALFLILSIIALIWFIRILNHVKRIIEAADKLVGKVDRAAEFFERSAPAVAIGRLIANISEMISKGGRSKSKSRDKDDG